MKVKRICGLSAAIVVTVMLMVAMPLQNASADSEPPLDVPQTTLAQAFQCTDSANPTAGSLPVLLVHGTAQIARTAATYPGAWDWNYIPALNNAGINVCTVTLPNYSLTDIQNSAEYVVYAVRAMATQYNSRVDLLGFSQGNLENLWAVKYWTDVQNSVEDMVSLSAPFHGTAFANSLCATGSCVPAMWQMQIGANFINALNTGGLTPGQIHYTSLYTATDEAAIPQVPESASVSLQGSGATNIQIQGDVCPLPPPAIDHMQMTYNSIVYALVLDAFTHNSTASVSRVLANDPSLCTDPYAMPGVSLASATAIETETYTLGSPMEAGLGPVPSVSSEPLVKSYAAGN